MPDPDPNVEPSVPKSGPNRLKLIGHANRHAGSIWKWTGWNKVGRQQEHPARPCCVFFPSKNGAKIGSFTSKGTKKKPK